MQERDAVRVDGKTKSSRDVVLAAMLQRDHGCSLTNIRWLRNAATRFLVGTVAFSASDNNNRPLIFARRIRFLAAKYSFLSNSSWFTVPVTYARTRAQIIPKPP